MTTVAWWHCFAGIAGDMALGSLVDAGADLDLVERELVALPVGGWSLDATPVLRAGLACTRVRVRARDTQVVRTHAHIVGLITEARLPERARRRALAAFARLAEVEGRLHRRPPSQVHFHEVGGTDAIIDIVGTCVALELLGVDEVWASPVAQGSGMVHSAHGNLPVPVPAVVELLRGAPTYGTAIPVELTTPTGAALLATLCSGWGPMPAMEVKASGFGAGYAPAAPGTAGSLVGLLIGAVLLLGSGHVLLVCGILVAGAAGMWSIAALKEAIRRDRPFIVCEILPRPHGNERTREIVSSLGYTAYWVTPSGYFRVSRFDFDRRDSEDFLLSPVSTEAEIVTDLNTLWNKRAAAVATHRNCPSTPLVSPSAWGSSAEL